MNIDIIERKNVVKCANQKSAGENVKGQEREKKGRFVYTRRVQKENVRRMLIASVCFFVLFFCEFSCFTNSDSRSNKTLYYGTVYGAGGVVRRSIYPKILSVAF